MSPVVNWTQGWFFDSISPRIVNGAPSLSTRVWCSGLALLPGVALMTSMAFGAPVEPPQKFRVNDPALVSTLQARGARVLADYGEFHLLEVEGAVAATVGSRGSIVALPDLIELNSGALDSRKPEVKALRKAVGTFAGRRLHLIQFIGPIKPEWREAAEATGVRIIHYLPQNAYLVQGDARALARLQALGHSADYVQWEGEYAADFKLHPGARTTDRGGNPRAPATDLFAVQMVDDAEANAETLALLDRAKLAPPRREDRSLGYRNYIGRLRADLLADLAARPEVVSIQPYPERRKFDERQAQIVAGNLDGHAPSGPGYLAWLLSKGFSQAQFAASGFAVDVTDSGVDNGTTSPTHFGLYAGGDFAKPSRVIYNRLEGFPHGDSTIAGCDGHGTLNAHIVAGYNDSADGFPHTDAAGFHFGLGVCPFVNIGSSVIFDPDRFTHPNYADLQARAYRDGARISANSWGADTAGSYDVDTQAYDALVRDAQPPEAAVSRHGNQEMVIVFAAGNCGPEDQTVGSPGTAKNVITVGAAENVHSHAPAGGGTDDAGMDGCGAFDTDADSADDIAGFSSRGPCADKRQKPDLVAPGTHVTGGVAQSLATRDGNGLADPCFMASGACGLPGGGTPENPNNFFPLGQQFYTTSSGTSHSTPAVAGACALLRQHWINEGRPPPSPAMTKALLLNSARYLTGVDAGDTLPSPRQGFGGLNLGMALDGVPCLRRDQLIAEKFTASGQTRRYFVAVADPARPVRVTLAWTDAPGNTFGSAYNNDLDLTVTVRGEVYRGNGFSGEFSTPDTLPDSRNNVESVFLPAGLADNFVVTVTAANINSDGVPGELPVLDQDYALVIYNGTERAAPILTPEGFAVVAEACAPTNGVVDAGETVTVSFALRNIGSADTTNLVATLRSSGGVKSLSAPQPFGALVVGGVPVARSFSFLADGACGETLAATLELTENGTNIGHATFHIPLGRFGPAFAQSFDSPEPPLLPAGWTTAATGAQSPWVTVAGQGEESSTAVFAPNPGAAGVSELVSPPIVVPSDAAQLTFRHAYETEGSYDGGVLEMKIGVGHFVDILEAGGSFVTGGYDLTLNPSRSPIACRAAWSGNSGGFVTTTVNLPAMAAGQTVQFRWRCGSDEMVGAVGWYLDSVSLNAQLCCGDGFVGLPEILPGSSALILENCGAPNGAIDPGETVVVTLGLKNVGLSNTRHLTATLLELDGVTAPGPAQDYGVLVAGGEPVSRPFVFTASGDCGDTISARLKLSDGALDYGLVTFAFPLGKMGASFSEGFDGVSVPNLPPGWTASASGVLTTWATDSQQFDSSPQAVFVPSLGDAGIAALVSPVIFLPPGEAQLSFRHSHDLDAPDAETGADAGVLEIRVGEGEWTDILAAGGHFLSGGYTHTVRIGMGNPLEGRRGWSGVSGGFYPTVVAFPTAASGQPVQLRWLCGTDGSTGGEGWRLDSVVVSGRSCCGGIMSPLITAPPTNVTVLAGENVRFFVAATGPGPLAYQWQFNGHGLPGATNPSLSLVPAQPSHAGGYSVVVANDASAVTSSVAVLTVLGSGAPEILARWDFNSVPSDTNQATGTALPCKGCGSATAVGGVTQGFLPGSENDPAAADLDNSGWSLSGFPAQGVGNKSAGARFAVSTLGWENISVVWDQRVSSSASKYCRLQFSTNGTDFLDFPSPIGMNAATLFETKSNNLAAVAGINDNPAFAFRLVTEFESTATGAGNASYATASTTGYAPTGSLVLDLVTVWGRPIHPVPAVVLRADGNPTGQQFQFSAQGTAAALCVVEASADLTNWVPLRTNTVPFTFSDADTAGRPQRFYRARLLP